MPEHAKINYIDVRLCVNLTNIVLQPATAAEYEAPGYEGLPFLLIAAGGTRHHPLHITRRKTMDVRVLLGSVYFHGHLISVKRPIQWTVLEELPKMEIRTHATGNGKELEVIWREGNLQITDAVNDKWRDHIGASPLRFPLAVNSKAQQFFRIRRSR